MSLVLAILIAGEELRLAQPLSEQEFVDFLNADANPSVAYDCRFIDRAGKSYRVHFTQSGGYAYFKEGYEAGRTSWTVGKSPTITAVHTDETSILDSDNMPSIFDANLTDDRVRFQTRDGHTTSEFAYNETPGGEASLKSTTPPPPALFANEETSPRAREHNRSAREYREDIYDRRPQSLVGFCDSTREIQPPLDFEQYVKLADMDQ